jgi:hypothetical protein
LVLAARPVTLKISYKYRTKKQAHSLSAGQNERTLRFVIGMAFSEGGVENLHVTGTDSGILDKTWRFG